MKMGKNMKNALLFANKYAGWHSYTTDRPTVNAINRLKDNGLVEVNEFQQFKVSEKGLRFRQFTADQILWSPESKS